MPQLPTWLDTNTKLAEYKAEQQRKEEEREAKFERKPKGIRSRTSSPQKLRKARVATFYRSLDHERKQRREQGSLNVFSTRAIGKAPIELETVELTILSRVERTHADVPHPLSSRGPSKLFVTVGSSTVTFSDKWRVFFSAIWRLAGALEVSCVAAWVGARRF